MRTKSQSKDNVFDLKYELNELGISKLAKSSGYTVRSAKKVKAIDLLATFYSVAFISRFSLGNWAAHLSNRLRVGVSKQAIFYRINDTFTDLCRQLISRSMDKKLAVSRLTLLGRFSTVYVHDSTTVRLPNLLNRFYKGNYSKGQTKAVAKLQVCYELTRSRFSKLDLTPYCVNDQAAAPSIVPLLKKGDLIIRDLGYFVLETFSRIIAKKAHFISKYKAEVTLWNPNTGQPINLRQLLKNRTFVRKEVLIGKEEQLPVLLIANKVSPSVALIRRTKAKKDRDKRKKLTDEKLQLMGWDIFITSIRDLSSTQIRELYKLRWQIEIIFKSWKSGLKLESTIPKHLKHKQLAEAIIYMILLCVIILVTPLMLRVQQDKAPPDEEQPVSLLKLVSIVMPLMVSKDGILTLKDMEILRKNITYEARKRKPFTYKMRKLT